MCWGWIFSILIIKLLNEHINKSPELLQSVHYGDSVEHVYARCLYTGHRRHTADMKHCKSAVLAELAYASSLYRLQKAYSRHETLQECSSRRT